MFELPLSIFCAYQNAKLAGRKGQNPVVWVFITMLMFFLAYGMGAGILVMIMYKGPIDPDALKIFLEQHPFMYVTVLFIGLGGYLLVRYILERMPDVKKRK